MNFKRFVIILFMEINNVFINVKLNFAFYEILYNITKIYVKLHLEV